MENNQSQTFKFTSLNIPGSTRGMYIACVLVSPPMLMAIMDKLPLRHLSGGALAGMWILGSVVLSVALYKLAKNLFFVRRHTVVVTPLYVEFDGVQYTKNFGFTPHEEDPKSKIYFRNNGKKKYLTGYVPHEQGEVFKHLH